MYYFVGSIRLSQAPRQARLKAGDRAAALGTDATGVTADDDETI